MTARGMTRLALVAVLLSVGTAARSADDYSDLDRLKGHDAPIVINFKDTPLSMVLGTMAQAGSFKLTLDKSFRDERISIDEKQTTIKDVLIALARQRGLTYSVPSEDELVVGSTAR